jgi:hypothetical protein
MQRAWRPNYREHVKESLLSYWRRQYRAHDWFDRWLLRGEQPPDSVRVVTAQEYRRCVEAWDFAAICARVGIDRGATYVLWLKRRQIPCLGWLKWLFGWPAAHGSFVVGAELQRLRHEMSRKGIVRAANCHTATIWTWENEPRTCASIRAILAGDDPAEAEGWHDLPETTRQRMEEVRRAASLEASCGRVKNKPLPDLGSTPSLAVSKYYTLLREAERCGVKEDLLHYLRCEGGYGTNQSRQSGLVADNFFIPTPTMLAFRAEAERVAIEQKVWSLQSLPGFDDWFLDWATPKPHRGSRHRFAAPAPRRRGRSARVAATAESRTTEARQHVATEPFPAPPVTVDNHEQVGKSVGRFVGESVAESLKPFIPHIAAAANGRLAKMDPDEDALVVEDKAILAVLSEAGHALTNTQIAQGAGQYLRTKGLASGMVRLSETKIRERVPILEERGLVSRPLGLGGKVTARKGVGITDKGRAWLKGNPLPPR